MIRYVRGNLLDDPAEAVVNTVNEVGVMGKGVALMFRERYPENAKLYEKACKEERVQVGKMFVTRNPELWGARWIINFPTKKHWRNPSRLEWIRDGLKSLVRVIRKNEFKSIALPPLGCGNGGLEWSQVRREMEAAFAEVPGVDVAIYAPSDEYQNAPKREGVEELTPARALIADLVRRYSVLGLQCTNLEVQKLAYVLHRSLNRLDTGNPLNLTFVANRYGPYSDQLRHVLDKLDGSYLHCEKRLADAGPMDAIWFEYEKRARVEEYLRSETAAPYLAALEETAAVIDGFESPLLMELLATVDWLLTVGMCRPTVEDLRSGLADWPGGKTAGRRKLKLFDNRLIRLAIERLTDKRWSATN